jgi:ankyrin repeat protein
LVRQPQPGRALRGHPDLDQLKRQAKELLDAFIARGPDAVAEVTAHYRNADAADFALHDAQLVLARSYGFDSWPKLKAYVNGANVRRLADAVRAGDAAQVQAMLKARPELVHMDMAGNNEHRALHYAVLHRAPEMVRLLMQYGADARQGIYPHRDATSALTLATERGYDEIVAIIREQEQRRAANAASTPAPDKLYEAIRRGDNVAAIATLEAEPAAIHSCDPNGWTPLHVAAASMNETLVEWLLERGADANRRGPNDRTALDLAAELQRDDTEHFAPVAGMLLRHGAPMTARSAVALGVAKWVAEWVTEWVRAPHAEGTCGTGLPACPAPKAELPKPIEDSGLLTIAVKHDRPEMLALLLDLGFHPDERVRVEGLDEAAFSWGMPLWHCAGRGKHAMAELLLTHGADPNARVYASGSPVFQAYGQRDWKMVELLERYGGVAEATTAGLYRRTDLAKRMLYDMPPGPSPGEDDLFAGKTLAEQLLWGAACGGDPEIVRMALEHVNWARGDPRWYGILEQPLRIWNHGSGHWASPEWDRGTYLTCFRLVLERCDANVRGRFGLTILHDVAGSRGHVTAEERVAFATMLLDAGARMDVRDQLLNSTPLGWACRWGRVELVKLLLARGADRVETDAEPWASPKAWAQKMGHGAVLAALGSSL